MRTPGIPLREVQTNRKMTHPLNVGLLFLQKHVRHEQVRKRTIRDSTLKGRQQQPTIKVNENNNSLLACRPYALFQQISNYITYSEILRLNVPLCTVRWCSLCVVFTMMAFQLSLNHIYYLSPVTFFVCVFTTSFLIMSPAAIHEKFKMLSIISIYYNSGIAISWRPTKIGSAIRSTHLISFEYIPYNENRLKYF